MIDTPKCGRAAASSSIRAAALAAGAATSLLAALQAQAADAVVVAEPEPVEYVRICDAYGTGYLYIPGTETCLRIGGYVRYQIGATSFGGGADETPDYYGYEEGWNKTTRARLNLEARSETEWGTLRAYIRYQASWGEPNDGAVAADQAWLSLGGLRMGYSESLWAEGIYSLGTTGSHSDGGLFYGDQQRHLVQYNFESDPGLFGGLSIEDDTLEGDGYVPDAVALLGYQAGWGGVWGRVGYDQSYGVFGDDGFGASIGVQINTAENSSLRLIGYYADGDHDYGTFSPFGAIADTNGQAEWSAIASYYHQLTERFGASVGGQYFSDFYVPGTDFSTGIDGYSAELSLVWEPVEQFEIRSEAVYQEVDGLDGTVGGFLWFRREF